jgi:hypothetical protein
MKLKEVVLTQQEENFRLKRELAQVNLLLKAQETINEMDVDIFDVAEPHQMHRRNDLHRSFDSTSTEVENFSDSNSSQRKDEPNKESESWVLSTSSSKGIAFSRAKARYEQEDNDDYYKFTENNDENNLKDPEHLEDGERQPAESLLESNKNSINSSTTNKDLKISDPYNIIHLEDDQSEMNNDYDDCELSDDETEDEGLDEEDEEENDEDSLNEDHNDSNELEDEEYEGSQENEQSESYECEENDQEKEEKVNTSLEIDFFRNYYDEKLLNELV